MVVLLRPAGLSTARERGAPRGSGPVLERRSRVLPHQAWPLPNRHLSCDRDRSDQGAVGHRHKSHDFHAELAAHPQDHAEARLLRRPGRLRGCRDRRLRPRLSAGLGVGGEGRLLHQHRTARQHHPSRDEAARGLEARPLDLHLPRQALAQGCRNALAGHARSHVRGNEEAVEGARPKPRHLRHDLRQDRSCAGTAMAHARRRPHRLAPPVRRRRVRLPGRQGQAARAALRREQRATRRGVPLLAQQRPRGGAFSHPHQDRQGGELQQVLPDALHGDQPGRGRGTRP